MRQCLADMPDLAGKLEVEASLPDLGLPLGISVPLGLSFSINFFCDTRGSFKEVELGGCNTPQWPQGVSKDQPFPGAA